jgi:hypothetical protein
MSFGYGVALYVEFRAARRNLNTLCLWRLQVATAVHARSQNRMPAQLRVPIVTNLSITT